MGNKVTFDPVTKIIQIDEAPTDGIVDVDVKIDLYSDGKEDWIASADLAKLRFPIRSVGGDPIPNGFLGATFYLDPAWKIRPYEGSHWFRVDGNLYSEDGTNPFIATVGSYNVQTSINVSALVFTLQPDEIRQGNTATEYVAATEIISARKVAIGSLNYIVFTTKADDASDWSEPTSVKTLYAWYTTLGDTNPQYMKGET